MFDAIRNELSQGQRPFSGNWRPAQDGQWKTPWRLLPLVGGLAVSGSIRYIALLKKALALQLDFLQYVVRL